MSSFMSIGFIVIINVFNKNLTSTAQALWLQKPDATNSLQSAIHQQLMCVTATLMCVQC